MGRNPSRYVDPANPVEQVSWHDAIAYCNRRSELEGLTRCYEGRGEMTHGCDGYRLPTEAEWRAAAGINGQNVPTSNAGANLYGGPLTVPGLRDAAEKGTVPVDTGDPNAKGLHHIFGNVWEWVWDRYHADRIVDAVDAPMGPQTGYERVILGGSLLTSGKGWNHSFRSSMPPGQGSAYVGFRVARSLMEKAPPQDVALPELRMISAAREGRRSDSEMTESRARLSALWLGALGEPQIPTAPTAAGIYGETVLAEPREAAWNGRLLTIQFEPGVHTRALLMVPATGKGPWPVVVVPFYDVDTSAGVDLGGRRFLPASSRSIAHLAVLHGMAALAVRWAGENNGPGYLEVVAELARRHPHVTGLGYWVWQSRRLADWIAMKPELDASRVGIAGHSLGGKMALYAGAFEPRYRAVVSSEPGIALAFSNYGDPWYLGESLAQLPTGADHHQLLQLTAPRPFLLIAGESADGEKSVDMLQRAANASRADASFALVNHGTGHSPTAESMVTAMKWLRLQLVRVAEPGTR
jgi:predicted esterase